MDPLRISDPAIAHLDGRPLVLRASPRHGCCGGHALVPVAEVGPPADPDRYVRSDEGPVTCYLDPRLDAQAATWQVELVGFARWRRLQLVDARSVDPARGEAPRTT